MLWSLTADCTFTVSYVAEAIGETKETAWNPRTISLLQVMWDLGLPTKIQIFVWRVLNSRLPTKDQLMLRGALDLTHNLRCVFCDLFPETTSHLFHECHISDFGSIFDKMKPINSRIKVLVIWCATFWSLWITRNAMIFDRVPFSFDEVCSNLLCLSWRWLSNDNSLSRSSFYDWHIVPLDCFKAI